jgi:PAS domain S-box-containing protein
MTFRLFREDRRIVLKIVAVYSLFGGLWICLSDSALGWLVRDPDVMTRIATYKGLLFIAVTAALLYYLIGRYISRLSESNRRIAISEERFQTIFNSITDAVFIHDAATGRFIELNRTVCDMFGYNHDEMMTLDVNAISLGDPPYSHQEAMAFLQSAAQGVPQTFEWHCRRSDGSLFWTEICMRAASIAGEARIVVSVRDISERISADIRFKEHEALLNATIESLPFEFFAIDSTGCYAMQNATTIHHWGNVIGKRPEELPADPSQIDMWSENNRRAMAGEMITKETAYELPGGTRYLQEILTPIKNRNGDILGILGMNIDQSEQKKAELALRENEVALRSLLELMPVGIACADGNGTVEYINRNFIERFGYELHEIPTVEAWFIKAYPDAAYREKVLSSWNAHVAECHVLGTSVPPRDVKVTCKDGTVRHIIINTHLSPHRTLAIFTDITERENLQEELIKKQKLESIGVLAGGIAHDFNNILTGILGNISFAGMFIEKGHKSSKPLSEAEKAAKRAAELAQQLLTFARGGEPVTSAVSLRHVIDESLSLVLRGSNVAASVEVPEQLPAIEADAGQISQVFNNLIINAVQAMPGGGTITFTAGDMVADANNLLSLPLGRYVRVTCIDQGCGIPPENLKNIFDPYFTTKSGGTGLGLASVHSIISKHGGHISVRSSVGRGTTFELLLPASREKPASVSLPVPESLVAESGEQSVLVMDDEEMIRELVTVILEERGYRVTTCSSGEEAIDLYRAAFSAGIPFRAVIMDLTIPGGMGGKEAAGSIFEIDPAARLIVSSGYSMDPVMANFRDFGFHGAVFKPYSADGIAAVLKEALKENVRR